MSQQQTILVVEDDAPIRIGIVELLKVSGFNVLECANGDEGLRAAIEGHLDLALLDVFLPGIDGFELLERIRKERPGLPVIMVTARGAESDRIRGLEGGADDYVVKPFSPKELLARINAVLRRSYERIGSVRTLTTAGISIDLERSEVLLEDGQARSLSERNVQFLAYLAESKGRSVSRDELLLRVWGINPKGVHTRTVDMLVKRLREKLGDPQESPRFIQTVRARGYMLGGNVEVGGR